MTHVMTRFAPLAFAALLAAACSDAAGRAPVTPHPAQLVGRWVRLREDSTWGDTMSFMPDGTLRGSVGYEVPPGLTWRVERDSITGGPPRYCATQWGRGFCRPYRLTHDTLELLDGTRGPTLFRRVR